MSSFDFENDTAVDELVVSCPNYHTLLSIVTFILLPPFWFLSIPALVFSSEAKSCYNQGYTDLSVKFSEKARRFSLSAWIIFVLTLLAVFSLYLFINY